jgi:rsbT co-antagonist protein RsbR
VDKVSLEKEEHASILNTEVVTRLASVGQIAAGVAHEIRNPLTSVQGLLQLLQEEHDFQYWDLIFAELNQAISTIESLLSVSKPSLQTESITDFSLCVELENILSLFQQDTYRIQFKKKWLDKAIKIRGKRSQIKQALFNLIKNACESIEHTGVVTIEHVRVGECVHVVISDTGVGISTTDMRRLGVPFFTTKPEGTGMGLTQVYSALYEHGATIDVKSTPGEGTTFTLALPVSPRHKPDVSGGAEMQPIHLKKAEDIREFFQLNRKTFNEMLENEAATTFEIVSKSKFVTEKDLLDHANQITELVHDGLTQEIIELAQERGMAWAKSDIPIISKMEWFYALRKVIWRFMDEFYSNKGIDAHTAFAIADRTSDALDNFIVHFNVSFAKYREDVLQSQKSVIKELSVPVIPIFEGIAVFPIIGRLDNQRLQIIEDRLLEQLENRNLHKLFIDVSGAITTEEVSFAALERILDGVMLLGCEAVLTGISAKMAKFLLGANRDLIRKISIQSTLQQALLDYSAGRAALEK